MSLLKKIGTIMLHATQLIIGLGPVVVPQEHQGKVTLITDKLSEIQQVILHAEAFGQVLGVPGVDKARAAGPAVAQIILSSAIVGDREIENPEMFLEGSTEMGAALAKILNSLKDKVETEDHA